jgi:hypothetical protein
MLKYCPILCLLALVTFIQSISTNDSSSSEKTKEQNAYDDSTQRPIRNIKDKTNEAKTHITTAGISYTQRTINDQCFVEYDGKLLGENSVIKIRRKVFRVEDCVLERVYHACGPNLLLMLGVVCRFFEQDKPSNTLASLKREASSTILHHLYPTTNRKKRVITESCCENLCSISELTRYCHE